MSDEKKCKICSLSFMKSDYDRYCDVCEKEYFESNQLWHNFCIEKLISRIEKLEENINQQSIKIMRLEFSHEDIDHKVNKVIYPAMSDFNSRVWERLDNLKKENKMLKCKHLYCFSADEKENVYQKCIHCEHKLYPV